MPSRSKVANGPLGLERIERDHLLSHDGFHVEPGGEYPLGQHVVLQIDLMVEIHDAQVGHAQVINVRESQGDFDVRLVPVF